MRKTSILLVGFLILLLFSFCAKKPAVKEETKPPTTKTEETTPPETGKEEISKRVITQDDLQPIYFDFDKYDLRSGDREILNLNATVLKENPSVKIRIEGNCDERGTVEYNLALGERRAAAARDYLINLSIDADRISIISYGKERPKYPGQNEAAWSKNRRDDFVIVSQ
jgi:peptidoglycan-associated lipoprotein